VGCPTAIRFRPPDAPPACGSDEEVTGIYVAVGTVEHARFDLPDPARLGDFRSCRLLRNALRLGFRSSAGPFRSFAHLAIEPRPYQLVPLLMALKLDPIRILISDDVGIAKRLKPRSFARELLDRGEVTRLAVLCPPQLAEQWQRELRDKFNIEAELVLPGTATRLERGLPWENPCSSTIRLSSSPSTSSNQTPAATSFCEPVQNS